MAPPSQEQTTVSTSSLGLEQSLQKLSVEQSQMASSNSHMMVVPTAIEAKAEQLRPKRKRDDVFLYYSDDNVRIKSLKLESVSKHIICNDKNTRKKRITFELHPDLVLEGLIHEIFDDKKDAV